MTSEHVEQVVDNLSFEFMQEFPADEIKHRPQGGRQVAYIDARQVMDRLDSVAGWINWSDSYQVIDGPSNAVQCTLTITFMGDDSVTHSDVGYPVNAKDEPLKAAYSDALKRAAVKFGIGRHLYSHTCDICTNSAPVPTKQWDNDAAPQTNITPISEAASAAAFGEKPAVPAPKCGTHNVDMRLITKYKSGDPIEDPFYSCPEKNEQGGYCNTKTVNLSQLSV